MSAQKRPARYRAEEAGAKRVRIDKDPPRVEEDMAEDSSDGESSAGDMSQIPTQDLQRFDTAGNPTSNHLGSSEAGVMERIELVDFMCHRKLDVPLSPNVNFILGRNGSGKSAIMTAIVVALGGKATATHRGSSLKQFIRTGAKSAEVIVTLRNRGGESYKQDEYGDKVVVHRTIRDDGTTTYKIKGAHGRIVSSKKEDLVLILDHWNIQVDNPVSLLNQDTSRNFLHSNNPAHKYKLFMKATRLEQIYHDYEKAREDQELMQKSIARHEGLSEDFKVKAKELEEKVEMFHRLQEMEGKVNRLEMELQWVLVMEIESEIPPLEQQIERENTRIPRNEKKIVEYESKIRECNSDLQRVGKELEEVIREAETVREQRITKNTGKRRIEREMKDIRQKLRTFKVSIGEKTREKRALEQKMEDLIRMSQRDTAGEREQRQREQEELQAQLGQLQADLREVGQRRRVAEEAMEQLKDRQRQHNSGRSQLDHEVRDREERVRRLQSSRSDQLMAFGPWMRTLVQTLQQEHHQFRKPPKGPVGSMIKLRDYRWSVAIEAIIGRGFLSSFVVDNTHDGATFRRVAAAAVRNARCPDTITSRYSGHVYNVSRNRPRTQYPTVLDMVDIADPDIINVLIDECRIDTILLIERRSDAERVIEVEHPPGAEVAYTIEGDQILRARFYANKKPPLGIIRESVDKAIQEEQSRLSELSRHRQEMERSSRELSEEVQANKRLQGQIRNQASSKQREIYQAEMRIKELQSAEEEEESQEDIATYENEIQECDSNIQAAQEQKSQQESQMTQLQGELEECENGLSAVEAEAERMARKMEEIKGQHTEFEREKQKADGVLKHYQERVRTIQGNVSDLQKQVDETQQRAQQAAATASEVCERIETQRTRKSIETEIKKLKKRIQQEEPQVAEKEAIQRQYIELTEKYRRAMEAVRKHKSALKELQKGLKMRLNRYEDFQNDIANRASLYFRYFLQQRDYDGELRFSHSNQTLSMTVQVDTHTQCSQATKNTKSLSGGERSFTTVCFIMSLWEAIEAPFRCLDEFDVFMDMLNRRISMRMMMEFATEQQNKQFIFFTPQDMSQMGVKLGSHVRVQKLRPPDRCQSTLD